MDLKTYIAKLPRGTIGEFAERLGITRVYLGQLANRSEGREPAPKMCVKIELVTAGKVTRRELRPDDWREIWPELIPLNQRKKTAASA